MTATPTTITVSTAEPKPRRPAAIAKRASAWTPDPRWAHPLAATLWCYSAALVLAVDAFAVSPLVAGLLGPAVGLVGVARARRSWAERDYGADIPTTMSALAVCAGFAAGAWLWWAVTTSPLTSAGWLVLGSVVLGGWYAVLRSGAPRVKAQIEEAAETARQAQVVELWGRILAAAGLGLRVVHHEPTRAGYALGVEPIDPEKPVTLAALRAAVPDLTAKAAALLAPTGVKVRDGDLRPEGTEVSHVHVIHVCTVHVMEKSIPFEPITEPTTIADPIDPLLYEDGRPVEVTFGGPRGGTNGLVIGATGSGKSVLTTAFTGKLGECVDCLVGVVAVSKLVPFSYPWIKPWLLGQADRPGIDFAAGQDMGRVMEFLAGLYRIVCERNARASNEATHTPTPRAPAIVVFIEEAGKAAARRKATVRLHTGETVGFSQLVSMICSENRSAQVSVILLNQSALFDAFGDYGPEIMRNTPVRICGKTLTYSDGMNTLVGLDTRTDTTKLRDNTFLVQPAAEDTRPMPAKALHLEGDAIHPVAIRNARWRPELEPDIAALLGDTWVGRWDAARLPELAAAARRDGLEWPVGQIEDEMDVELRRIIEQGQQAEEDPPAGAGGVEFPDAAEGIAELTEIANRPGVTLPEPLGAVIALLGEPQAPKDWISTRQLAILLGRVDAEAAEDELKEAARKLGRDLSALDGELRAEPRDRKQGYRVDLLRRVARRLAGGGR